MTHEECTKAFYNDICEMYDEEGLSPEIGIPGEGLYVMTIATCALDDGIMRYEHYEAFKEYARAFYRSRMYAYNVEAGEFEMKVSA